MVLKEINNFSAIMEIIFWVFFDVLPNFPLTTSETKLDY